MNERGPSVESKGPMPGTKDWVHSVISVALPANSGLAQLHKKEHRRVHRPRDVGREVSEAGGIG